MPHEGGDHWQCHIRSPISWLSVATSLPVILSSTMKLGASAFIIFVCALFTPFDELV